MSLLDMLLTKDISTDEVEEIKINRLEKEFGEDATFKIKTLNYNTIEDIRKMDKDIPVHVLLAGDAEAIFKNKELMERYNAATPAELVKKILRHGEIKNIASEIERLSGYTNNVVEIIKKK